MLKFSVITPSYNQGEFIRRTIDSVLEQNYPNFEHIVVDGGSTDNTVEILKSYPHLQWTSAKDNGQTDALNRGLARATGDIIAWMNSDDWFAPNTFATVAKEMEQYPIVVGECDITDREGKVTYRVPNVARTCLDIAKYWVPYSIPTQPSIFFRRDLLEQFRLSDGKYLDEELDFCMDFELWLRMFKKHEFRKLDQLFCYYRMYETNKTGGTGGLEPHKPEMSRIFKRHELAGYSAEHTVSVVIPADKLSPELFRTLESISTQSLRDFEILVIGYSNDPQEAKRLQKTIRENSKGWYALRYAAASENSFTAALNTGFEQSCGRYLVYLEPGAIPATELLLECVNAFDDNRTALILPCGNQPDVAAKLLGSDGRLVLDGFFTCRKVPFNFAIRKLALTDLGGFTESSSLLFTQRALLLRIIYKGWGFYINNQLAVDFPAELQTVDESTDEILNNFINAGLVVSLDDEFQTESFAKVRAEHGCTITFDTAIIQNCREILANLSGRYSLIENSTNA